MRNIIDFINESYNKNYVFKRKTNKDGSDTTWWAIVKYLAKNGPSTKKEVWDGLGWRYNPATFRGQDSTEIAAMRSAGLITYNTGTSIYRTITLLKCVIIFTFKWFKLCFRLRP